VLPSPRKTPIIRSVMPATASQISGRAGIREIEAMDMS
jgi:3-oxoacyl-[acyl-carrier-protein] synthase III